MNMDQAKKQMDFFSVTGINNYESRNHLATIDTLRGISVVLMLHMHCALAWHSSEWSALSRLMFYTTDFVAPALYTIMSILANMISLESRRGQGGKYSLSRGAALRASFLFMYGESLNILTFNRLGWYSLTTWNVILVIAVFTLILPSLLKIKPVIRIAIAACIAIVYFWVVDLAMTHMAGIPIDINNVQAANLVNPATLPYWLLFYHDMMTPIFSWMIIPLVVPLVFSRFVKVLVAGERHRWVHEIKRIAGIGSLFVLIGVVTGLWRIPDYVIRNHVQLTTPDAYFTWPFPDGEPLFLIRHTPQYMIYNTGMVCLLFSLVAYIQLPTGKRLPFQGILISLGKMSLTGFNLSLYAFIIPLSFSLPVFYIIVIPGIVLVTWLFHAWYTKGRGIGSLEWLMHIHVNTISYYLDRYRKSRRTLSFSS
ncbi:MAG: hypothetical protein Q6373_005175 [Candidatus Sigynarchaeota archaeon]